MNRPLLDKIVNAVLYEAYILYPYRPSSKKNRQRFTFGRVYPEEYSVVQKGAEPCFMQTECLARKQTDDATLKINVRFLHPMAREAGALKSPLAVWPVGGEPEFNVVPALRVDDKLYQTWQEAVEREVDVPSISLGPEVSRSHRFEFPASRSLEALPDSKGQVSGVMVRRQEALQGVVEVTTHPIDRQLIKVTVRILNKTPIAREKLEHEDEVVLHTFSSTHTVLHVSGGEFISSLDPVAEAREEVAGCKNIGTWPVLIGDEQKGERDTMLSSPIILYDYPKIAPESAGDLFDSTEIDEILTLRTMTMTDDEKLEMRHVDEHARRILERTEAIGSDQLLKMHGTMRDVHTVGQDFFNPAERRKNALVGGVSLKVGDRVRIRPKKRADVMDIALDGKIAIIEAVEEDVENQVHFALILEDDPGKDLGLIRQPGHRFFYGADEVEPVGMKSE